VDYFILCIPSATAFEVFCSSIEFVKETNVRNDQILLTINLLTITFLLHRKLKTCLQMQIFEDCFVFLKHMHTHVKHGNDEEGSKAFDKAL